MATRIGEVIDYLHNIAPSEYQESYDNSGLLVGSQETEVKGVLISLDCTEVIVEEAIQKGCNLIVSHHPIVFKGLKRFNGTNYVERTIIKAIKNDIALLAIHTNLDNVFDHGVNSKICSILGLAQTQILAPKDDTLQVGSGMIGQLNMPKDFTSFLDYLKSKMDLKVIKHTDQVSDSVQKIAVCGGSGSFLLKHAINQGADVYITADFKYHEFFDADGKITIIDIGHYESERFTIDLLYDLISNNFSTFAAHCTKLNTNPVKYY